jgi:hypothetical protein
LSATAIAREAKQRRCEIPRPRAIVILDSSYRAMWLRSRCRPLKLGEIGQAIVILAFAFVIPVLFVPTVIVLFIVLLDRLGLTFLGKVVVVAAVGAVIVVARSI